MAEGLAEVELAVLACMSSSPRVAAKVADMLVPRDFLRDEHRVLFATMSDMLGEGQRIDELTLSAELRKDGHEAEVLGAAHELYAVASGLASVDHAVEYAGVVREESVRRALGVASDAALGKRGDVEHVVAALEVAVFDARSRLQGEDGTRTHSSASILGTLDAFLSAPEQAGGFPYPFPYLREHWGVFEKGRYAILAGYSNDGKSVMLFQWVEDICEAGGRVVVYEQEMLELGVARLLTQQGAGITVRQAKGLDAMTEADMARYEARKRQVAAWDLTVVTGPTTPGQIRADQMRERYDVVFVDHMQKFPDADDYSTITRYSSQLHRIARDLGCSVVCLSQIKTPQDGSRPVPTPQMLRGTRTMEEDVDSIFFVYRKRKGGGMRSDDSLFIVAKMRDGETDKAFPITLDTARARFFETATLTGPSVATQKQAVIQQEVF